MNARNTPQPPPPDGDAPQGTASPAVLSAAESDPGFETDPGSDADDALPEESESDASEPSASQPESERSLVPRPSAVPQDTLSQYFQEIARYPLLSRDEEHALAVEVHDHGSPEAAHKLVLSNLRLVVRIAMEYRRVWTNLLDLIQEGNVGLLQAVRRYDPHRGVKLSSYGAYWIRAYILKYLIDNIRTVRVGSSRAERKIFYSLNRARRDLERQGFVPTPALLAERLDVAPEDVESVQLRLSQSDVSLDAPLSDASGGATFGERQSDPGESLDDAVSTREMQSTFRQHVERFAADLDDREAMILQRRLLSDDPATLQEIGEHFGLTRERVRQIEKKLIGRLREYLEENLVDFELWAPDS